MKVNKGRLSMNNEYKFIGITDKGEMDGTTCDNCGHLIRYICELIDVNNKHYFVGTECVKTLTEAKISNVYSMNEQIKEFKKVAEAQRLIESGAKVWQSGEYFYIVGKLGKAVKKVEIRPVFDMFEGFSYSFVDSFLLELKSLPGVIKHDWCFNDIFKHISSLKG